MENRIIKFRYTFQRLKDDKLYQSVWSLESIEKGSKGFYNMLHNKLWKLIGKDQFTGFTDKKKRDIFENDIVNYAREKMKAIFLDGCFCFKAKNEFRGTIAGGNSKWKAINIVTRSAVIVSDTYHSIFETAKS